jgi:hypothetical protein
MKGPVLQAVMSYKLNNDRADWPGFVQVLKETYEPRNKDLMLRYKLRNLEQINSFAKYLNEFQVIINQLSVISEQDKFVAFLDGLSNDFKYEVLKNPACDSVTHAVRICSDYDFCLGSNRSYKKKSDSQKQNNVYVEENDSSADEFDKDIELLKQKNLDDSRIICWNCHRRGHKSSDCTVDVLK